MAAATSKITSTSSSSLSTSITTTEITKKTTTAVDNNNKLNIVTSGLQDYYVSLLKKQSNKNILTIVDYLSALNTEVNSSLAYKSNQIKALCYLSIFCKQKPFIQMSRDDILKYLDSIRRPEESDPCSRSTRWELQ